MAFVTKYLYRALRDVIEDYKDPRVQHLPLVTSPLPVLGVIAAYLALVLHYGPKWMEKREPFNLKYVMRVYNAIQGLLNSYFRKEFSLTCQPVDHTNTEPWMLNLIYSSYAYYITKYLDLLDTIFFVLRKKNSQITFLHVYHHAGMVFGVYAFMTALAGSHSTMLGIINLFIHTVMYAYYFVTSVRPVKRALWWKRHITQLQLLQFGYLMVHYLMAIVWNHCQHPMLISFIGVIQNLFMFTLFFDFYYKEYVRKPKLIVLEQQQQQQRKQQSHAKEDLATTTQTVLRNSVQTQLSSEEFGQFENLQQACAAQAAEQLNSCCNSKNRNKLHLLSTSSLLKTKCS